MSRFARLPLLRSTLLAAVCALASAGLAHGYTLEQFRFEDPARQEAFRELIGQLRCLVCQNESLAGSQASVAQDLREEVYRMMREGQSRQEIIDFLVARYGDFVLYEPPLKPSTYILWIGPFLFVGGAAVLLLRTLQRKKAQPEPELSAAEQARLQALLASTREADDAH